MADIKLARKRFKYADDALKAQRQREKDDLGFYEGETQWPEDIKSLRAGQQAQNNSPSVPARPCLTINKVRDPIRRIQNDELQADLGMTITAADDFGGNIDATEIEFREGLARRIQRQSYAMDARMWAAGRAAICGTGWYGITTDYTEGHPFDQEIRYLRFYDQFSILADPNHEQPDGSDIDYAFEGRDLSWETYKDTWPKIADGSRNPLAADDLNDSQWRAFADDAPGWVQYDDGDNRFVRVTKYWYHKRDTYEIVLLDDGSVMRSDALDKAFVKSLPANRKRMLTDKRVMWALIDGVNTLDEGEWEGRYIPLIKVVGEEIHVFDKERRYEGAVRPARDPQKAFNAMVSNAVETIALAPKSQWLIPSRAIENFLDIWRDQSVRNWPYLPYDDIDPDTGQQITPPKRETAEPPIQAMAAMISAFAQAIDMAIGQANLADTHPDVRSGTMADTIISEAARGTSNYLANLIRSVHREGLIINDLLFPIYGQRKGRILSILTSANKTKRVLVGQPFVTTDTGMPTPHDAMNLAHAQVTPEVYALTPDGSFNVAIEATRFFETKKQERIALMGSMLQKSPEQVSVIGDLFFEAIGEPEMAKRYSAVLDPRVVELLKSGQPPDPRIQQLMQMGQQISQELMQLKADKGARIEQAQIKAAADATTTDADNQSRERIARIQQETAVMVADLKATVQQQADANAAVQEQMRTLVELLNEDRLARRQREHERDMMHHGHAHELGMAMVGHQHAKDEVSHEADVMPRGSNGQPD